MTSHTIHLNAAEGKAYGPCAAALLGHIRFWVNKNEENGLNLRDGRTWTYDSFEALAERLVMFTAHQVRRGIEKLIRLGVIVKGYFGHKWNRTSWYTLAESKASQTADAAEVESGAIEQEAVQALEYDYADVDAQSVDFLLAKGVDHQIALDWMVSRSNKAVTPKLWAWVKKEAKTAGITPQDAVKWACQRGCEIFKASWYLRKNPKHPRPFFDDGDYSNTVMPI